MNNKQQRGIIENKRTHIYNIISYVLTNDIIALTTTAKADNQNSFREEQT